jgi:murein DD-endopeptidase MepM/ murein hydrolase activator NlpD
MQGRVGVVILVVVLFAAGLGAGAIHAGSTVDPPGTTTSTEPTTTGATTTVDTTSVATTTTATTTTVPATTETRATVPTVLPVKRPTEGRCLLVGAFELKAPAGASSMLGPTVSAPRLTDAAVGRTAVYPADASIVSAAAIELHAHGCASATARVRSLSLFGGAVKADAVALEARNETVTGRFSGLVIRGKRFASLPRRPVALGSWGHVALSKTAALSVRLLRRHAGLAAGTVLQVAFAIRPEPPVQPKRAQPAAAPLAGKAPQAKRPARHHRKAQKRRHKKPRDAPLTATPPLGVTNYVFPVAGESGYGDTYGAFRGGVPGNWHHGDDIFARVGTPVVAVADGTLNRVGWERLGGWRLWVRDAMRNEFYYAHLSGYSPLALSSRHVKAGDVIGFIGNTGDAFTTPPHLHFEVHPHQFLRLGYNGAVNPTGYLNAWPHVSRPHAPRPMHPPFPAGAVRAEARYVWRELLAARGLITHAPKRSDRPQIRVPRPDLGSRERRLAAAAHPKTVERGSHASAVGVVLGLVVPTLAFGTALLLRLRRRPS